MAEDDWAEDPKQRARIIARLRDMLPVGIGRARFETLVARHDRLERDRDEALDALQELVASTPAPAAASWRQVNAWSAARNVLARHGRTGKDGQA